MGLPPNGWFINRKSYEIGWFGGTPILGKHHLDLSQEGEEGEEAAEATEEPAAEETEAWRNLEGSYSNKWEGFFGSFHKWRYPPKWIMVENPI